jgi:hypothetical protein
MARGDKNYDKVVRKVNKGEKSDKKINAVHKMVEALISGDSDAAAEHLHTYLQEKTRDLILGEKEKPDFADIDDDGNKKESMKKAAEDKEDEDEDEDEDDEHEEKAEKEEMKESVAPKANLTKARGPEFAAGADKGKISGNSLRNKPKKSNDTKARGPEFHAGADKGKVKGNSLKNKPHKSNDTKARGPEFHAGADKGKVAKFDDGRDYDMGTGNV